MRARTASLVACLVFLAASSLLAAAADLLVELPWDLPAALRDTVEATVLDAAQRLCDRPGATPVRVEFVDSLRGESLCRIGMVAINADLALIADTDLPDDAAAACAALDAHVPILDWNDVFVRQQCRTVDSSPVDIDCMRECLAGTGLTLAECLWEPFPPAVCARCKRECSTVLSWPFPQCKTYGLGYVGFGSIVYYWPQRLREAGVAPEELATYDGFVDAASRVGLGVDDSTAFVCDLAWTFIRQCGGIRDDRWSPILGSSDGVRVDRERCAEGLERLSDVLMLAQVTPVATDHLLMGVAGTSEFASRRVGMLLASGAADLEPPGRSPGGESPGVMPLPSPHPDRCSDVVAHCYLWIVPAGRPHQDLAIELVATLVEPESMSPLVCPRYIPVRQALDSCAQAPAIATDRAWCPPACCENVVGSPWWGVTPCGAIHGYLAGMLSMRDVISYIEQACGVGWP